MFIDTTQIIQLEEAKAQFSYQKQMLANVSHEFRTPLNAMNMSLVLLEDSISPENMRFHQIASSSCDILKALVEDILDHSKIEAGTFEIEDVDFEFEKLFSEVNSIFILQTTNRGIQLNFDIDKSLENMIFRSDKQRLKQILLNLISNALKFTDSGSISINLELDIDQKEREVHLDQPISDFEGITEEFSEDIHIGHLDLLVRRHTHTPHANNTDIFYIKDKNNFDKSSFVSSVSLKLTVTDTGIGIPIQDQGSLFKLFGKTSSNHDRNKTG